MKCFVSMVTPITSALNEEYVLRDTILFLSEGAEKPMYLFFLLHYETLKSSCGQAVTLFN